MERVWEAAADNVTHGDMSLYCPNRTMLLILKLTAWWRFSRKIYVNLFLSQMVKERDDT